MAESTDYRRVWIAGTDTGVGKTLVSTIIVNGLQSSYWKPVQSGISDGTDTECVRKLTGLEDDHFIPEGYTFSRPLSPHLAARLDHTELRMETLFFPDAATIRNRFMVMETAGGLMVPLNDKHLMIDLMKQLEAPVILVCRSTLGTINHTLLSVRILRDYGFNILGFIMNGPQNEENEKAVVQYGQITHLGSIPPLASLTRDDLSKTWQGLGLKSILTGREP